MNAVFIVCILLCSLNNLQTMNHVGAVGATIKEIMQNNVVAEQVHV